MFAWRSYRLLVAAALLTLGTLQVSLPCSGEGIAAGRGGERPVIVWAEVGQSMWEWAALPAGSGAHSEQTAGVRRFLLLADSLAERG